MAWKLFHILKTDAASGAQALACFRDPAKEARVVLKPVVRIVRARLGFPVIIAVRTHRIARF